MKNPQNATGEGAGQSYAGLEASSQHFLGLIPAVPSAGDQHPTQSRHSSAFRMTGRFQGQPNYRDGE